MRAALPSSTLLASRRVRLRTFRNGVNSTCLTNCLCDWSSDRRHFLARGEDKLLDTVVDLRGGVLRYLLPVGEEPLHGTPEHPVCPKDRRQRELLLDNLLSMLRY